MFCAYWEHFCACATWRILSCNIRYGPNFRNLSSNVYFIVTKLGGGPRVVVSTAAFHARVRGSVPGLGGLKETKIVSSPSTCES